MRRPEDSKMPSWLNTDPCRDLRGKQGQIATEELKEIAGLYGDKGWGVGREILKKTSQERSFSCKSSAETFQTWPDPKGT